MIELPRFVRRVKSRGRYYYYYQEGRECKNKPEGQRVRIKAEPHEPRFWQIVAKLNGDPPPQSARGTFAALIEEYKKSPEYKALKPKTASEYARYLVIVEEAWGTLQVRGLKSRHVLEIRDSFASTPAKANYLMDVLSSIIGWSIPREYIDINPCQSVKKLKTGKGYAPWPWEAINLFKEHARPEMWQAAALALYTGQRQGDVLAMKWSDINNGVISVVQGKTGKAVWVPVHRDLQIELDKIERRSVFILTNSRGKPWGTGFKASWTKQRAKPEIALIKEKGLVFHGLRKSAVVFLLEAGCTDAQVSSITGQTRQMVEHYSIMVNNQHLAKEAILKWEKSGQ